MRIFLVLIFSALNMFSCKKEEMKSDINNVFHKDLTESGLAKDSLQKMDLIFEKLNKKNIGFLDFYVTYFYRLDKETQEEIKKSKGEHFLEEHSEEYYQLFSKTISEKGEQYLNSFGISNGEEMLAREVYVYHLKKKYGPKVDGQLENLNK